jgi:hypothetical protein
MQRYDLDIANDPPYNGGEYVVKNGNAGEKINFHSFGDGIAYGFVETRGDLDHNPYQIHIERLVPGAGEQLDGVNVVFCAKDPYDKRTKVVGWYKDATVYRHQQKLTVDDVEYPYFFQTDLKNSVLIPQEERDIYVPTVQVEGYGMGQANVWYADKENVQEFVHGVLVAMGEA